MASGRTQNPPVTSMAGAIRLELARRDWTQSQLAEHLGVSQQQVNYWATGRREPAPQWVPKLAKWLGMPLREAHALVDAQRNPEQRVSRLESKVAELEVVLVQIQTELRKRR